MVEDKDLLRRRVCMCINVAAGTTEKRRLIMADVFQRAQLSCLMWKTFRRFSFFLCLKKLDLSVALSTVSLFCPKPQEAKKKNLFMLLKLSLDVKALSLKMENRICIFHPRRPTLTHKDTHGCNSAPRKRGCRKYWCKTVTLHFISYTVETIRMLQHVAVRFLCEWIYFVEACTMIFFHIKSLFFFV